MNTPIPSRVEIGDSVIYQKLHDEVVVLNMTTQQYFGLDDVGASMWHLLVELGDVEAVTDRLQRDYEADRETIAVDLQALVSELLGAGLLKSGVSA